MKIQTFKDLVVWQKSVKLALETYKLTSNFPKEEIYGLTSQMRRSAVSVPSNIAEGFKRWSRSELVQFLSIAQGSLAELETQIYIAQRLEATKKLDYNLITGLIEEVSKMLYSLAKVVRDKIPLKK